LIGRFIAGIEPARGLELFGGGAIVVETLRLMFDAVRLDAKPVEILGDALGEFLLRALEVGVVIAQHEPARRLAREEPVKDGGAAVADMYASGWGGRKAYERSHVSLDPGNR